MPDRFRPDAAVRRVSPIQRTPAAIPLEEVAGWLDDPRIAGAVRVPGEVAGKRADRVIVDDPHCAPGGVSDAQRDAARALFEHHGPTASVGRRSFPRSHRGEGRSFVD